MNYSRLFKPECHTILLYPLLLPVLNVNSYIFSLISSDWFYICFHSVVLGQLLVQLSAAFVSC